jgi:electron transport complex protein RnfD
MNAVSLTLLPAVVLSVFYFGARVIPLYLIGIASAVLTEALAKTIRGRSWKSVLDGSAVLTGILLVMILPPTVGPAVPAIGGFVAILVGKEVFGGLGQNVFNPALVGRAFLSASFPVELTSWAEPNRVFGFLSGPADAVGGATVLGLVGTESANPSLLTMFFGQIPGSIGETSALMLLAGGIVLMLMRIVRWQSVVAYLGTAFAVGYVFHFINPDLYPSGLFHLLSGGLMLGAVYMATCMVTSPFTNRGAVIFGVGAGLLTIIIRLFGALPEGVAYSILIMNAVTPIINRYVNNTPYGAKKANAS